VSGLSVCEWASNTMILTGSILFCAEAVKCYHSPFFRIKAVLLVVAGLNALAFHKTVFRKVEAWTRSLPRLGEPSSPAAARWPDGSAWRLWDGVAPMLSESDRPYFEWRRNTWLGTAIRGAVRAFPLIQTFYLLASAALPGAVLIASGILTPFSEPIKCFEGYSFRIKMGLIVVGTRRSSRFKASGLWMRMRRNDKLNSPPLSRV
jgi:hypothetical protein